MRFNFLHHRSPVDQFIKQRIYSLIYNLMSVLIGSHDTDIVYCHTLSIILETKFQRFVAYRHLGTEIPEQSGAIDPIVRLDCYRFLLKCCIRSRPVHNISVQRHDQIIIDNQCIFIQIHACHTSNLTGILIKIG